MAKRPIVRVRGRGTPRYRAPSHRYLADWKYYFYSDKIYGLVKDIVHDPGRNPPMALIKLEDGREFYHVAPHGLKTGDVISINGEPKLGSILMLKDIPEGTKIYGLESFPGSGPRFARTSGSFAIILSKSDKTATVLLPSGKIKELDLRCRASIGVPAGEGRHEKPFLKAGKKYHAMRARNRRWPMVSPTKMNAVDHPWGGTSKRPKYKLVHRTAPPGQKVGSVSPKRTGRKK